MPDFTITLSDAAVAKLQEVVADYNRNSGTSLTVKQWLLLHLKKEAICSQLAEEASRITEEMGATLRTQANAAILAKEQELLAAL